MIIGSIAIVMPSDEQRAAPGLAEVRDLRVLVVRAADAVADEARTTEKPASSTTSWTACEMSPTRLPGRACSIPAASAAWQTSSSRCASASISPTANVYALSAISAVERDADVERDDVALRER